MKLKSLAIGLMAGLLATPVLADEPKSSWSGVYLGLHGGTDNSATDVGLFNPGGIGIDGLSSRGMAYGAHIGADYQIPGTRFVLGVGGDYTWSDSEFNVTTGGPTLLTAGMNESWAVYGRAGLDMGRVMPYVLVGYTEADVSATIFPGTPGAASGSDTMKGWLVGGGFEMALGAGFFAGGEYRYTMFDTLKPFGAPGLLDLDTDRHEVRATLKYKANFF